MTHASNATTGSKTLHFARAQLTLVEHALCPLDSAVSLTPGFVHQTHHFFTDKNRNRRKAVARVGALDGLSAHDELYLWGLLSLALAQPEPIADFSATPYYVLSRLGVIAPDRRGGREFEMFRAAIKRLAAVRYQNDHFYDPIRGEHRQVSFGFLNYSLPLNPKSARAWRFAWDPIFFELAQATGGALAFDLTLYRELDAASRRLYLFLKKLFFRAAETTWLDVRHLTIDVLGFSATLPSYTLKRKLGKSIDQFLRLELLRLPEGIDNASQLFRKLPSKSQAVQLFRGPRFSQVSTPSSSQLLHSPHYEPLKALGLDAPTIRQVLNTFPARQVELWSDITLAALESKGKSFFKRSPAAYFLDNLRHAAKGERTPPDWWHAHRKRELAMQQAQQRRKQAALPEHRAGVDFDTYLKTEVQEAFSAVMQKLLLDLRRSGKSESEAHAVAEQHTRSHFRNRYRRDHPEATAAESISERSNFSS